MRRQLYFNLFAERWDAKISFILAVNPAKKKWLKGLSDKPGISGKLCKVNVTSNLTGVLFNSKYKVYD
jgi:hypothetical protein